MCNGIDNMKHFLKFIIDDQNPKTNIYAVYNINDVYRGSIRWYPSWRQYVFISYDVILSRECARQLADFIDKIQKEQKENKHGVDNK